MTDQEFVSATMDKISAIKEYKEKYGEDDIIASIHAERMLVLKNILKNLRRKSNPN